MKRAGPLSATLGPRLELRRWLWGLDPRRLRERLVGRAFDREHGVETSSEVPAWRLELTERDAEQAFRYEPTPVELFHEMMAWLPIEPAEFSFVDLGSGKGRVVMLASALGFERVVGVELSARLHRHAETNVGAFRNARADAAPIELVNGDAADFAFDAGPLVLYLFSPFREPVMRQVTAQLTRMWQRWGNEVHVVYHNPRLGHLLEALPFLERGVGNERYAIFSAGAA